MRPFDMCVLTAANEVQADGYRHQIQWRRERGLLSENTDYLIIPDPHGKRVGSGGSTLYALFRLLQRAGGDFNKAFKGKRILIIHSGGDSRRLPAYSPHGKIFVPLPTHRYHALFDIMQHTYAGLPELADGQVIITSGDVLLNFDAEHIHWAENGITGVAYPDDPQAAAGFGVFVVFEPQNYHHAIQVADFLQKPSYEELVSAHAIDYAHRTWIDTGILNLSLSAVRQFLNCEKLLEQVKKGAVDYNLYQELLFAILGKKEIPNDAQLRCIEFNVSLLPYCGFFHIGRSEEFLHNLYTLTHASALYKFANQTRSNAQSFPHLKNAYIYNSLITSAHIDYTAPVLIENCTHNEALVLGGDNMVTGVPAGCPAIRLEPGICLAMVPLLEDRWAAVIYGLYDHFKAQSDAAKNLFLNRPLNAWMDTHHVDPDALWSHKNKQELWQARLFPVSTDPGEALAIALRMQENEGNLAIWRDADRLSLAEILQQVDHPRLLRQQQYIERQSMLGNLELLLAEGADYSVEDLFALCENANDEEQLRRALYAALQRKQETLREAQLSYLYARTLEKKDQKTHQDVALWMERAFVAIRKAVGKGLSDSFQQEHRGLSIRSDEVVWVSTPARLDFAGGWSDTPPYCLEHGGSVLNAAVILNGQYPIQVIGKINPEPVIRINSIDLGATVVIRDYAELLAYTNPAEWASLPKSAFVAAGIVPAEAQGDLGEALGRMGGGIDLTLFSALPAGSGLGTSSILGAALIACLSRMYGLPLDDQELFLRTSLLEQQMTTGGGWQDQIGGVVGGVKLIQTAAGYRQSPGISWTHLHGQGSADEDPFLLYYTGYRRMAKNILRQIVGRFLNRDREVLQTVERLKSLAVEMKQVLDQRQMERFGELIAEVWVCNKRLDSGSTTPEIEQILAKISKHMLGAKLLGAGGGGFLFIVSKSMSDKQRIRQILEAQPPNDRARFFDFRIDPGGLKVNVL